MVWVVISVMNLCGAVRNGMGAGTTGHLHESCEEFKVYVRNKVMKMDSIPKSERVAGVLKFYREDVNGNSTHSK